MRITGRFALGGLMVALVAPLLFTGVASADYIGEQLPVGERLGADESITVTELLGSTYGQFQFGFIDGVLGEYSGVNQIWVAALATHDVQDPASPTPLPPPPPPPRHDISH